MYVRLARIITKESSQISAAYPKSIFWQKSVTYIGKIIIMLATVQQRYFTMWNWQTSELNCSKIYRQSRKRNSIKR